MGPFVSYLDHDDSKLNSFYLNNILISAYKFNISHELQNHIPWRYLNITSWYFRNIINSIILKPNIVFLLFLSIFIAFIFFFLYPHCYCWWVVFFSYYPNYSNSLATNYFWAFVFYPITTERYNILPSITEGH